MTRHALSGRRANGQPSIPWRVDFNLGLRSDDEAFSSLATEPPFAQNVVSRAARIRKKPQTIAPRRCAQPNAIPAQTLISIPMTSQNRTGGRFRRVRGHGALLQSCCDSRTPSSRIAPNRQMHFVITEFVLRRLIKSEPPNSFVMKRLVGFRPHWNPNKNFKNGNREQKAGKRSFMRVTGRR